jgi:hypothetical protein
VKVKRGWVWGDERCDFCPALAFVMWRCVHPDDVDEDYAYACVAHSVDAVDKMLLLAARIGARCGR